MKKEKIIQIAYEDNSLHPTLLTESGKVYRWAPVRSLGKQTVNYGFGDEEIDKIEYAYREIETI